MKLTATLRLILVTFSLGLAGCASGPSFTEVADTLEPMKEGFGRIYFYRSNSPFGSGIQPTVHLNGEDVGSAVPGGVFFRDVPPGDYEVITETEVDRMATFTVAADQTRYVRLETGLGVVIYRVFPVLVDPIEGESEIQTLVYIGG